MRAFAILAPVPAEHLKSAHDRKLPLVDFTTDDAKFFLDVDKRRRGEEPVCIYFYQSNNKASAPSFEAAWSGVYEGWHRIAEPKHRPPTTRTDVLTGAETFYRVSGLAQIAPVPFHRITLYKSGKKKKDSAPRKPLLIFQPDGRPEIG